MSNTKKHSQIYKKSSDETITTCSLCGNINPAKGVVFKGHCVCEKCLEYVVGQSS